jgi:UDP-N-acetylmuramoyl-tripeptide--D-alanyl-D-alanine ligase
MRRIKDIIKKPFVWLLIKEAGHTVRRHSPQVVAVVGSVGKTTTKDAVYQVLSKGRVAASSRKNEKSQNSDVGTALTVLDLETPWSNPVKWIITLVRGAFVALFSKEYPKLLVMEVGADRPGEVSGTAAWLSVDVVVLTRWGDTPVHVEAFASPKALMDEDRSILKSLKAGSTIIQNIDDIDVMATELPEGAKAMTYGFASGADVQASSERIEYAENAGRRAPVGMAFKVSAFGEEAEIMVRGAIGRQHVYPILAAIAAGAAFDMPMQDAFAAAQGFVPPRGRMNVLEGINDSVLIDDTYNSSPVAVHAALDALVSLEVPGKRIVALGDMRELGEHSAREHHRVGEAVAKRDIDVLVVVGKLARMIAEEARVCGMSEDRIIECVDSFEAAARLAPVVAAGDAVLVKGSQGIRMERVSAKLLRDPASAGRVLVRQEKEWEGR